MKFLKNCNYFVSIAINLKFDVIFKIHKNPVMKRKHYTLLMLVLCSLVLPALAWAQVEVTGKVTDASTGDALPGVAVTVQGTTIGTQTDLEGNYEIAVPDNTSILEFRFLGFAIQTATADQNVINIALQPDAQALSEVVVTALGIERNRNELVYAAQEVEGEALTRTRGTNFVSALSGKVAGLDIKSNNTMGGSTNVIIRGYKSITGNNQALFVVDGVPVSNANTNTPDQMTGRVGTDFGNAASDINPDNIASVNVLKGAAATALYGARASNGVVMITTKKGQKNSMDIVVNSGLTFGTMDKSTYARYQKEYGAGYEQAFKGETDLGGGVHPYVYFDHDASFGPKFDPNLLVYQWDALDPYSPNYGKPTPWVGAKNDPTSFFENSVNSNQSIMIRGGGDKSTYKFGYTRSDEKGILPNSTIDKDYFVFSGSSDITDKLTVSATANYTHVAGLGRYGTGYNGNNPNQQFRQWWQTNVDLMDQKEAYFRNRQNVTWNWADLEGTGPIYSDNPYWTRYENYADDSRDHYYGYVMANYQFTDWLDVMGRVSIDGSEEIQEERVAVGSASTSQYSRFNRKYNEVNLDLILNFNKNISEDFSFRGLLGGNMRRNRMSDIRATTNGGLVVPGLYSLSNSLSPVEPPEERLERVGVDGIFANATFGYKETVFLELAGRRDQTTTLPSGNNVYYYPSAGVNFLFSNVMESSWLTHGKLRLNYAEAGNDPPALSIYDTYDKPTAFGSVPVFSIADTKNNEDLKPERTKSIEAGVELEFLDSRIGLDVSLYKTNTIDQLIPVTVTSATGYTSVWRNSGEVQNKGIEVAAYFTPVRSTDFSWTLNLNFSKNESLVKSLYADVRNIELGNFQGAVTANAAIGQPFGVLRGTDFVYTNGQPTVNEDGFYMATPESDRIIGDPNPDWLGGIGNSFRYKDLSLNFMIDIRHGGDVFSLDQWYGQGTGLYEESVGLNADGVDVRLPVSEGGGIVLPGVKEDGSPNDIRAENVDGGSQNPFGYINGPRARYVYDGSYVKLREVALSYSLPQNLMENLGFIKGIDISLVGRNLWIISKNMKYADPEEGLSSGNINGYQSGAYPAVKTYGFNLRLNF